MNSFASYHHVIQDRINSPGAEYYPDFWWEKEIKELTSDIAKSAEFIATNCTDEELFWLSEVFDDIAEMSHSAAFFHAVDKRAQSVQNEAWKREILECSAEAKGFL